MRINYFDLGLFHGTEMFLMESFIIPKIEFPNFFMYGFEACKEAYDAALCAPWIGGKNVKLFNVAVCGGKGQRKIYYAENANPPIPDIILNTL